MISAGKVSATTIDRSRTTNGCRGSGRTRRVAAVARASPRRSRFSSATNTWSCRGAPRLSAIDRRDQTDEPERRVDPPATTRRRLTGDEKRRARSARSATGTPSTAHSCSTSTFDVEEVDVAGAAGPVIGVAAPGPRDRRRRASRPFAARTARRFRTARRRAGRGGGCARRRRPVRAASDGRSVSNFADSGFAMRDG